jgi:hypothetical protein
LKLADVHPLDAVGLAALRAARVDHQIDLAAVAFRHLSAISRRIR